MLCFEMTWCVTEVSRVCCWISSIFSPFMAHFFNIHFFRMCSPETLPLTMEPESGFYCDPVIVLDFQSLYPSIIIAYNYCFTTCLGKVSHVENIYSANRMIEFGGLEYNCPVCLYWLLIHS